MIKVAIFSSDGDLGTVTWDGVRLVFDTDDETEAFLRSLACFVDGVKVTVDQPENWIRLLPESLVSTYVWAELA